MKTVLAIAGVVIKELYRRKDFYVLLVLTFVITSLLGMINFFNDPTIVRYLKEICLLLIWISSLVICITTAARQIHAERENRTIFPLLAKPVTRWQVMLGKFTGCWLACGMALLVFYLCFGIGSELRRFLVSPASAPVAAGQVTAGTPAPATSGAAPREQTADDHDASESGVAHSALVNYLQAIWLHWILLGVVTALVLLGSVIFSAPSANNTISFISVMGILLLGEHLHKVALRSPEPAQTLLSVIYFLIPHLEWYDIRQRVIYDQPPIAWAHCGLASLYGLAYALLFLYLAWLVFRRKTLTL
jgi:ABC-type transport system involved in multi-copper enzyme maturation permease subunit